MHGTHLGADPCQYGGKAAVVAGEFRHGLFLGLFVLLVAGGARAANVQANVDGGGPEARRQSETTIVEFDYDDPADTPDGGLQDVILVGYNDFNPPNINCWGPLCYPWVGLSRSVDGAPFQHTALPGQGRAASPSSTVSKGDPVFGVDYHADVDGLGNPIVYLVHMASPVPPVGRLINRIYVSASTDGGRSFPATGAVAVSNPTGGAGDDKPWIAVDQRGGPRPADGNVYVCWTRVLTDSVGNLLSSQILLSQMPPAGPPGPEIAITPVRPAPRFVQSCQVAVDVEGHVYVSWTEFLSSPTNTPNLMIRHADPPSGTDPVSFDPAVQVEQIRGGNFGIPNGVVNCAAPNWLPQTARGPFLYNFTMNAASLATNPINGDIYLAWSMWNGPTAANGAARFDVFLKSGSRPGDVTDWNRKRVVNRDGATATDQFMPSVTTHPLPVQPVPLLIEPTLAVAWSDKRNSGGANNAYEIFGASGPLSSDGAVSDAGVELMNPPPVSLTCRIGDYNGLTSAEVGVGTPDGNGPGTYFLHAWGDTRNGGMGDPEVFFASEAFTPETVIELPPIAVDLGLLSLDPRIPAIQLPVGDTFPVPVDLFLVNNSSAGPMIDTWLGALAGPEVRTSWIGDANQADACFAPSPPDMGGPAVPVIGVPCTEGPIVALGVEQSVSAFAQVSLTRSLEVSCMAEGTFEVGLIAGTGPVLPLEARDTDPTNNGLEAAIDITCLPDPHPPAPGALQWSTKSKIEWSPVAGAASYRLYRGEELSAPQLGTPATDSCLRLTTAATDTGETITEVPPAGSYLWFLAHAVDSGGLESVDASRSLDSAGDCATCGHDKCSTGPVLDPGCDGCVSSICAVDPYCCGTMWDDICVMEVRSVCRSLLCAESGGACAHTLCRESGALDAGCDDPPVTPSCVDAICAVDPYCCGTRWDAICVDQVVSLCGLQCR